MSKQKGDFLTESFNEGELHIRVVVHQSQAMCLALFNTQHFFA